MLSWRLHSAKENSDFEDKSVATTQQKVTTKFQKQVEHP